MKEPRSRLPLDKLFSVALLLLGVTVLASAALRATAL